MGKTRCKERRFFNYVKTKDGKRKFECPYCKWQSVDNVTRLRGHLLKVCSKVPESVRDQVKNSLPSSIRSHCQQQKRARTERDDDDGDSSTESTDEDEEGQPRTQSDPKTSRQSVIKCTQFTQDVISTEKQKALDSLFSRALYATNTPFCKFEHPYWKDFFGELRPIWKVPSRTRLGNELLEDEYTRVSAEMAQEIAVADSLCVGLDGWSNIRRDSIVNILVFTPVPIFYESIDCGSSRHFGAYYAEKASKVIDELGAEKFSVYITDNCSNMELSGKLIEEKYKFITWFGCLMHSLHLQLSDINSQVEVVKIVFDKCSKITVEVKGKLLLLPIFKEKQHDIYGSKKVSLRNICDTRFGSNFACAEAVKRNKNALQALCVDARMDKKIGQNKGPTITPALKKDILSDDFWVLLDGVLTFLEPLYSWLFKVQTDRVMMSEVVVCFTQLKNSATQACGTLGIFKEGDAAIIQNIIEERKKFSLKDIHFAANLLDPFLNSDDYLSPSEKEEGLKCIDRIATNLSQVNQEKVSEEYVLFAAREGHFAPSYLWRAKKVSPLSWWKAFAKNTELGKVAIRVLSPPVSAGAIERSFSSQGRIHSKDRNRLSTVKSGKLTYLYENYRYHTKGTRPKKRKKRSAEPEFLTALINASDSDSDDPDSVQSVSDENEPSTSHDLDPSNSGEVQVQASSNVNNTTGGISTSQDDDDMDSDTELYYDNPIPDYIP